MHSTATTKASGIRCVYKCYTWAQIVLHFVCFSSNIYTSSSHVMWLPYGSSNSTSHNRACTNVGEINENTKQTPHRTEPPTSRPSHYFGRASRGTVANKPFVSIIVVIFSHAEGPRANGAWRTIALAEKVVAPASTRPRQPCCLHAPGRR